jgi:uncharacterized protein (TIGR02246 family)
MEISKAEKTAILGRLETFGKSLDMRDVKHVATHFTNDAVFVGGGGATIGRANIAKRYEFMYSGRFKNAKNSFEVTHVQMPAPNMAVVTAACVARLATRDNGDPLPDIKSNVVTTLIKGDGGWQIAAQAVVNEGSPLAVKQVSQLTK